MRLRSIIGLALCVEAVLFVFAACATTYHPAGATGGFDETKLNDTLYEVRFVGNGYVSNAKTSGRRL